MPPLKLEAMHGTPTKTCGCRRDAWCKHSRGPGNRRLTFAPDPNPCPCAFGHPCLTGSRLWQRFRAAESAWHRDPTLYTLVAMQAAEKAWRDH